LLNLSSLVVASVVGGVLVILGLHVLLWGKDDKDQEQHIADGKEHESDELDCEKQAAVI
jgi:hypothetical protein